ncbi:MAG: GtrA family protein [Proteobacteria bacterium]|nr:GtrA family protein [Pseudomonadota bacterium]
MCHRINIDKMTILSLWDTGERATGISMSLVWTPSVHYKRFEKLCRRFMRSGSTRAQVARFLAVGGSCMIVDLCTYRSFLFASGIVSLSKGAGFILGTTVAFFANRAFTFQQGTTTHQNQVWRFLAVYAATLVVNVGINSGMLYLLGLHEVAINISFILSTICSSALNFLGMKRFVFSCNPPPCNSTSRPHP